MPAPGDTEAALPTIPYSAEIFADPVRVTEAWLSAMALIVAAQVKAGEVALAAEGAASLRQIVERHIGAGTCDAPARCRDLLRGLAEGP